MALSHAKRRALALVILLLGLPIYIGVVVWIVSLFERPPILVELLIYVAGGIAWALPLRAIFLGVGKADPQASGTAPEPEDTDRSK